MLAVMFPMMLELPVIGERNPRQSITLARCMPRFSSRGGEASLTRSYRRLSHERAERARVVVFHWCYAECYCDVLD